MSTIGERIKQLRTSKKLSQQDLANLVGKSKGNISGYENDKFEPSAQTIISISKYFNVSTDWILTGVEFQNQEVPSPTPQPLEVSISEPELNMLEMFRVLDKKTQEETIEYITFKYERSIKKGKTMSSYSNYTDNNEDEKSDTNGKNSTSGIA